MIVSVVVPFRGGCPYRERAWSFIRARWELAFPDWQLITSIDAGNGPWRKGAVVRRGLELAAGDIIIVADSDVWSDRTAGAVELVRNGAPWAMPFTRVVRLTERATAKVLAGDDLEAFGSRSGAWAERPYTQQAAGGLVVLRRETAESIPIDPRFSGWGSEDEAWRYALETLAGRRARLNGNLFHLWHPPQPRLSRAVGSLDSVALRRRYAIARGNPLEMRALVAAAVA